MSATRRVHMPVDTRTATAAEKSAFMEALRETIESAQTRIRRFNDPDYEVRVMKVRTHEVVGHTRTTYERTYFSKVNKAKKTSIAKARKAKAKAKPS